MTRRCGCDEDGDETVFGPCRRCSPKPESVHAANLQAELDRLEREDPAVQAAAASLDAVGEDLKGRLPSSVVADIYDLERPYERTLSDGDGDLG